MYVNSAYLNNSLIDFKDKSQPLIVGSCGTYRLLTRPKLPTHRPRDDKTEVYWVHFTGSNVTNILRSYGISDDMRVINTGTSLEYTRIFKQMIQELQRCQINYEELLVLLLKQIFISIQRQMVKEYQLKNVFWDREMENAML